LPPGASIRNPDANESTQRKKGELRLISLSRIEIHESHQETNMEYTQQNDEVSIYQSNFRAEDGLPEGRWSALYEGVVVPLGSLFAVFLFMVAAMVLTH
jgi:hypothetical protein